ncbi:MAG: sulfurtransferase TusA family protein [Legionellales bacterium]|jgi:tRNA 2-thiouridine synthesizing protein A
MSISKLDTRGLACPLPLLKTKQTLYNLPSGETLWVISEQPSLALDIKTLLKQTQDILLEEKIEDGLFYFYIQKK